MVGREEGCQETHSCPLVPDVGVAALSNSAAVSHRRWGPKPSRDEMAEDTDLEKGLSVSVPSTASPDLFLSSSSLTLTLLQSVLS